MRFLDLIAKKRDGGVHTEEELRQVAQAASDGAVPDYQLSAWLMAVCCRGMTPQETAVLTREMARSGEPLDLSSLKAPKVDKHSTGGVGDGVSIALAPAAAACGAVVPMMSGRGLGHTGGTLDKLEAIPGFRVRLGAAEIKSELSRLGVALFGQTERLAPADRKLYALRDATATVQSRPLIVGSILSKKLAEDLDALVLDVKAGSGAIFKDVESAEDLAKALVSTAKRAGLSCAAVLTSMDQPLGRCVGNALEIKQALEVLHGDFRASDYAECLLALGGWMLKLCGLASSESEGARKIEAALKDGRAARRFQDLVRAQGGDVSVVEDPGRLAKAALSRAFKAPKDGFVCRLDARVVGEAAVRLGAGRATMEDKLDYGAGFTLEKKVGERVRRGETIATAYAADEARLSDGLSHLASGVDISPRRPRAVPVVLKVLK